MMEIAVPDCFSFDECLRFLGRSDQEVLHRIENGSLYKALKVRGEVLLLKISCGQPENRRMSHQLQIECLAGTPTADMLTDIKVYLAQLFDLNRDLRGFYKTAEQDDVLRPLAMRYRGLRIVGIPDLFEALTWAIIGQQITLSFAYTMKKRFTEQFGEKLTFADKRYWLYPTFQTVASLQVDDLRELQFTTRKAEYVIGVAKAMATGELKKEKLLDMRESQQMHQALTAIRGVGAWTADYVMMKCLQQKSAFPIADVGLHNALKIQLGLKEKPSQAQIRQMAVKWEGWEAYATFYLWRSLYDDFT
ncbi:DNA-3-methyladenine glycosylase family protein [Brevibacillus sp. NRS-1366]|uniref:DNA-3-methyladenine glycosylase family protein n=1 Tax=Brevibacillus sp. NRS-1366 TaxID=3233899 RepID=UPI003D255344